MSTSTVSEPADELLGSAVSKRLWVSAAAVLAVGAVVFGAAFWNEIVHAFAVWLDSTAYGHCFLIIPISAFLIWERRAALLARLPVPTFWPILAMLPVGLAWLLSAQLGVMEGRQLMAMTLFELFALAVLGFRAWRSSRLRCSISISWCRSAHSWFPSFNNSPDNSP